jgi:DNA-binding ferritin-like protein
MEYLILNFFEVTTNIKIYHWKTTKYSEHISCDELYNKLLGTMDRIAEVYLGTVGERFNISAGNITITNINTSADVKAYISTFIAYFRTVALSPELNNIREEAIADCNRFLYLQTLR